MPSGFYNWSQTSGTNATADSAINWAEGQSPSSVNDSSRAMMAVLAKWRDDISGAIVTGGTSTAYTVTTYSSFSTLALMNNQVVAFTPHATNGATVTLNVDGLGAKPLRAFPSVELQSNVLIAGTPYVAIYNSSSAVFYLQGNAGGTYGIPLGAGMEYWGATAPSSAFVFPTGQQISTTTYASLYAVFGPNRYGTDTGGNFYLPDVTGRVRAIKEASATRLTSTYFGGDSTALGATGGSEKHQLTTAQLAAHSHGVTDPGHVHAGNGLYVVTGGSLYPPSAGNLQTSANTASASTGISINSAGGDGFHNNTQPTIICNYIMRII